jgi:hypothetical protein
MASILYQLAVTVGILSAYIADYGFAASGNWRWMLGVAVVPGAMLGAGMLYLPETPRYLARHGHFDQARDVLMRARGTQGVDAELEQIKTALTKQEQRGHLSDLLLPSVRPANCGDHSDGLRGVICHQSRTGVLVVDFRDVPTEGSWSCGRHCLWSELGLEFHRFADLSHSCPDARR